MILVDSRTRAHTKVEGSMVEGESKATSEPSSSYTKAKSPQNRMQARCESRQEPSPLRSRRGTSCGANGPHPVQAHTRTEARTQRWTCSETTTPPRNSTPAPDSSRQRLPTSCRVICRQLQRPRNCVKDGLGRASSPCPCPWFRSRRAKQSRPNDNNK